MRQLERWFEISRADGNLQMEGLRGFAVFLVFLVHYVSTVEPWTITSAPIAEAMHTMGAAGVDLFFVLSGYLIYGTLMARPQSFGRYLLRRAQRIYPAFLVVLAIYIALSVAFPSESKLPAEWGSLVLYLVQNALLLPGLFDIEPIITVSWSLSYELFYYLVIPFVVTALRLRERSGAQRIDLLLSTAVIGIVVLLHVGLERLMMFVAGILLWEVIAAKRPPPGVPLFAVIAALGSTLYVSDGIVASVLKCSALFVGFAILCWDCFTGSWVNRFFTWTPLRWLGNMSYSYYLVHGLTLKLCGLMLEKLLPPDQELFFVLLLPLFLVTLVPSAVLFLMVERPLSILPTTLKELIERACNTWRCLQRAEA